MIDAFDAGDWHCRGEVRHRRSLAGLGLGDELARPEELVLCQPAHGGLGVGKAPNGPERWINLP